MRCPEWQRLGVAWILDNLQKASVQCEIWSSCTIISSSKSSSTHYPTCENYLDFRLEVIGEVAIPFIYIDSDEMVYSKLCEILWKNEDIYTKSIILMDSFHQLRVMQWLLYKVQFPKGFREWCVYAKTIADVWECIRNVLTRTFNFAEKKLKVNLDHVAFIEILEPNKESQKDLKLFSIALFSLIFSLSLVWKKLGLVVAISLFVKINL